MLRFRLVLGSFSTIFFDELERKIRRQLLALTRYVFFAGSNTPNRARTDRKAVRQAEKIKRQISPTHLIPQPDNLTALC